MASGGASALNSKRTMWMMGILRLGNWRGRVEFNENRERRQMRAKMAMMVLFKVGGFMARWREGSWEVGLGRGIWMIF
jgi:hypothetical protein